MSQTCRFGQYEGFHNYHRINYLRKLCVTIHWKSFVSKFDGLASEHVKGWDGWWGWREGGGAEGVHGGSGAGATSGAATARRQRRQSSVGRHWLDGSHASPFLCVWRSFHLPLPPPPLRSSSSSCAYVFCCGQQQQKRIDRCHDGYADIAPRGSVGEKQIHFLSFWIEKWAIMERWRRIWRISNGVKGEIFRLFTVFSQIWRGSLREVFS